MFQMREPMSPFHQKLVVFCPLQSKECDDKYGPVSLKSKLILSPVWHAEKNRVAGVQARAALGSRGAVQGLPLPQGLCRERSQPKGPTAGTPGSPGRPQGSPRPLLRTRCAVQWPPGPPGAGQERRFSGPTPDVQSQTPHFKQDHHRFMCSLKLETQSSNLISEQSFGGLNPSYLTIKLDFCSFNLI